MTVSIDPTMVNAACEISRGRIFSGENCARASSCTMCRNTWESVETGEVLGGVKTLWPKCTRDLGVIVAWLRGPKLRRSLSARDAWRCLKYDSTLAENHGGRTSERGILGARMNYASFGERGLRVTLVHNGTAPDIIYRYLGSPIIRLLVKLITLFAVALRYSWFTGSDGGWDESSPDGFFRSIPNAVVWSEGESTVYCQNYYPRE